MNSVKGLYLAESESFPYPSFLTTFVITGAVTFSNTLSPLDWGLDLLTRFNSFGQKCQKYFQKYHNKHSTFWKFV